MVTKVSFRSELWFVLSIDGVFMAVMVWVDLEREKGYVDFFELEFLYGNGEYLMTI